jgi:hypothetical protein
VPRSTNTTAKYVYGVVRTPAKGGFKGKGIHGKPLRTVSWEGLGALTSDVPDAELEAGRDELLTHSRVLERALERGAILPMRFGTVMPSEASVRDDLLAAHREELEAQLEDMRGKVEINIKGIYEEQPVLEEVVRENPEIAQIRESLQGKPEEATYYERIRLGELVAEALTAKREIDGRVFVDRLSSHAVGVEVGQATHERMAVNASFLVERDRLADFERTTEELGAEQAGRIRFRYTGPLPPHSFVELALEQ